MPPLYFPKTKHKRRFSPPLRQSYHWYKPTLREEFEKQCVYCRLPDTLKGLDSFGVDHYKPKKDFPHLVAQYTNLFYACNCCNRRKGTYWPDDSQLKAGHYIPNPCEHIMFDHLRYKGAIVVEHSETGAFAKDILDLNDDESVAYRTMLLDIIKSLKESQLKVKDTIDKIDSRIHASRNPNELQLLRNDKKNHEQYLNRLNENLKKLTGN